MRNETDHTAAMAFVKDGIDGGDSVSSVAAVYDRRRCLNCCTVGGHLLRLRRCRACASRSAATVGKLRNFQTESLPKKAHFFFVLFVLLIVPCVVRSLKEFSSG